MDPEVVEAMKRVKDKIQAREEGELGIPIPDLVSAIIGEDNYSRITVPPKIWFGFKGLSSRTSYILNISNLSHDPSEVERQSLTFLKFLSDIL